jgi:hypothetical protein
MWISSRGRALHTDPSHGKKTTVTAPNTEQCSLLTGYHFQVGKGKNRNVRFEVSTAVTMKNVVFWDIKTQFVPHRRYITSPLQSPAS